MPRPTNTQFAVAVHVLTYLAAHDGVRAVSSEEMATSADVNPVHVRRLLGPLRRAGLVCSRPGVNGGSTIGRPASEITLDEVWSLLQGDDPVLGVHGPSPDCPVGRAIQFDLHAISDEVAAAVRASLAARTVEDLLADAVREGAVASSA